MKVVLKISGKDKDNGPRHEVEIDGKFNKSIGPLCECPEDAIIGRDLVDGYDICKYIQIGYDAAKRGEELTIESIEASDDD